MANSYFQFKQFTVYQERCVMKVTTDACLFGAWAAEELGLDRESDRKSNVKNVLDIGTGTGLLSLMLAQKNPFLAIDAIEIDEEAYEQAKENVAISSFADQIHVINADVKEFPFQKKYDVIISNPPFYEKEISSADPKKNIAHHQSGLLLNELLSVIKSNLSTDGVFYLLLPFKRNEEIKKILFTHNLFVSKLVFIKQSIVHDYFRLMLEGKLRNISNAEIGIEEISIWGNQQEYTREFVDLLKDYYLNL